jgi:pSer/pThr/pTyr-binding forkhead associated (FHA) protein
MTASDLIPLRLVALDGGPEIHLDRILIVLGRHPGCDVRLDSMRVSRLHCCLMRIDGELLVRDLGSTNGVWINGRRVTAGRLQPGDELAIVHFRYRVEKHRREDTV